MRNVLMIFSFTNRRPLATLALAATAFATLASVAAASSNFDAGLLRRRDPAIGADLSAGFCRLFIGPRDVVAAGTFLLRIGDEHIADGHELELRGSARPLGNGDFALSANTSEAEDFYQQILHRALRLQESEFDLRELIVEIDKTELDLGVDDISCSLRLSGTVVADHPRLATLSPSSRTRLAVLRGGAPVDLRYEGSGTIIPPRGLGAAAASVQSAEVATERPAATCTPPDYTPVPAQCGTPNCMVSFAGYQWWTEYNYFPPPTYFYNNNNNNAWAPKNVTVDGEGLHPR